MRLLKLYLLKLYLQLLCKLDSVASVSEASAGA